MNLLRHRGLRRELLISTWPETARSSAFMTRYVVLTVGQQPKVQFHSEDNQRCVGNSYMSLTNPLSPMASGTI